MPTKALLYAAEARHLALYGGIWGMKPGDVPFDWPAVMARKDSVIKDFADYRVQQLTSGKFEFIRATGPFLDPHTLALNTGRTIDRETLCSARLSCREPTAASTRGRRLSYERRCS